MSVKWEAVTMLSNDGDRDRERERILFWLLLFPDM